MALNPKPKLVAPFTAEFRNIGTANELLHLSSTYPLGMSWEADLLVGTDIFLESAVNVADVPDEQLISSLSLAAILAGEMLPGTTEYVKAVTEQDGQANTKNFQTIVGEVRLKPETVSFQNPEPIDDITVGPPGTVFDVTFQKGTGSNIKVVRIDAWSISQYGNRVDSLDHMYLNVAGSVHKEYGYKKSDLGAAGSTARNNVINYIQSTKFWV